MIVRSWRVINLHYVVPAVSSEDGLSIQVAVPQVLSTEHTPVSSHPRAGEHLFHFRGDENDKFMGGGGWLMARNSPLCLQEDVAEHALLPTDLQQGVADACVRYHQAANVRMGSLTEVKNRLHKAGQSAQQRVRGQL